MLLGEDYQADLPQQRPRPSQPTPAEQQWLQHKALRFGELGSGTLVPEKTTTASSYAQWCVPLQLSVQLFAKHHSADSLFPNPSAWRSQPLAVGRSPHIKDRQLTPGRLKAHQG